MRKKLRWPTISTLLALWVAGGSLWAIGSQPALAASPEKYRYAVQPAGWDSPAGQCVVCHSLEKNAPWRVAPTLWGIVGAPKAGAQGYGYSLALFEADGVWTRQELDDYLADPGGFLPGTTKIMSGLSDSQERVRIIEFLATLKD